jgi:hypothetical protein
MNNYTYYFTTFKSPKEVFEFISDIKKWWTGFYEEIITGSSQQLNDEFTFSAGGGMHLTTQKLIEFIPDKKISWVVTESQLSFLENVREWENTKITFDISTNADITMVTFTHHGLEPSKECYDQCSSAWSNYLNQLKVTLQGK